MPAAEEAIRIDPELADAHVSLALVDYRSGRDWDGLDQRFERAVELNPNSANAWHHYSHYLTSTYQLDAALDAALRGREVDPLSRALRLHLAQTHLLAGRSDEAVETSLETLARYPDFTRIRAILGYGYLYKGEYDEAIRQFEAWSRCHGRQTISGIWRSPMPRPGTKPRPRYCSRSYSRWAARHSPWQESLRAWGTLMQRSTGSNEPWTPTRDHLPTCS